jgi:hypothetical protein
MMEQLGRGAFGEVHKKSAIMVSHRHMIHRNNGKSSSTAQSQACWEYLSNKNTVVWHHHASGNLNGAAWIVSSFLRALFCLSQLPFQGHDLLATS